MKAPALYAEIKVGKSGFNVIYAIIGITAVVLDWHLIQCLERTNSTIAYTAKMEIRGVISLTILGTTYYTEEDGNIA